MSIPKIFLVLPAYNEEADLSPLMRNLEASFGILAKLGHDRHYVIVDDGSVDGTPKVIDSWKEKVPLTSLRHDPNQGLGPTIRDGLDAAAKLAGDDDIIVSMDADNTHPSGLLVRMTQMILEGNDVVIASRFRPGSRVIGLSRFREFMTFGARVLFRIFFPIRGVRDYTCGYRAYRAGLIKQAFQVYGDRFVEHKGFQCMADILLKISCLKPIVVEAPMILRYDRKEGVSKMSVATTVLATVKLMCVRRLDRWRYGAANDSMGHVAGVRVANESAHTAVDMQDRPKGNNSVV